MCKIDRTISRKMADTKNITQALAQAAIDVASAAVQLTALARAKTGIKLTAESKCKEP